MKFLRLLSLLALLLAACGKPGKQYVVVLSMDGFRHDLAADAHTPTLDSLRRVGTYSEIFPVYPSNTFPCHYAMATGLHPDHHGVVNNLFYDRTSGRYLSVFNREDVRTPGFWGGEPIWNTAERQGCRTGVFMWPGCDVPIGGRQASEWKAYSPKPSYRERADWVIEAMTRSEEEIPQLVMFYFEEPDAAEHHHGPKSPEVREQVERIDRALRYFFYHIRKSPVYDRINFILTADHGMTELSEERRVNLYNLLDTTKVVRVVRNNSFGVEVTPDYLEEALRLLNGTGHLTAWNRDSIPARFHYGSRKDRLSNIIIMPELGWSIDYDAVPRPLTKRAAHGYNPEERDMHMVFYASGNRFKAGYEQASFQNNNLYLIICHLLGIEPAANDCEWERVKDMFHEKM